MFCDISDLTRHEDVPLVLNWSERTPASKNGPPHSMDMGKFYNYKKTEHLRRRTLTE